MRAKTLLVAAVMFLSLTAAAFAQATFTVGSTPVTAVVATGQTEKAGDVTFTLIPGSASVVVGSITVIYGGGLPLTSAVSATGIRISACSGVFVAVGNAACPTVDATSVVASGQVRILLPAVAAGTGSFTLSGVRVNVSGSGLSNLSAALSATGNGFVSGQNSVIVINAISAGIASVTTKSVPSLISVAANSVANQIFVKEGFNNVFGVQATTDTTQTQSPMVRILLSGAIPAGVKVQFPLAATSLKSDGKTRGIANWYASDSKGVALATADAAFTSASTTLSIYYTLTSDSDPNDQETLVIGDNTTAAGTGLVISNATPTTPLTASTVYVQASLAPIGGTTATPRYTELEYPATSLPSLFTTAGSVTYLLIPYASAGGNWDTGIAISNTSTDGLGSVTGVIPNGGTVSFTVFQAQTATAAAKSYTVLASAIPTGAGLDSTGNLQSGSTFTVLLSNILKAVTPTAPTTFDGYIVVTCNFTNAHGQYVIGTFSPLPNSAFYNSGQTLVIPAAARVAGETLGN